MTERQGCAPAFDWEIAIVSGLLPLLLARFRATLADAIRRAAAMGDFRVARRRHASFSCA